MNSFYLYNRGVNWCFFSQLSILGSLFDLHHDQGGILRLLKAKGQFLDVPQKGWDDLVSVGLLGHGQGFQIQARLIAKKFAK